MALVAGLDVGGRTVRLALVRTGLALPQIDVMVERPIDLEPDGSATPENVAAAIREVVSGLPPGVEAVHAALPGDAVSARLVDIPAVAAKKAEQVLAFELEALLPFDLATAVFHTQPAPGAPLGKARFLAAAAPSDRVERFLGTCREAGVDPRVLSAGALPLAELVPIPERRSRTSLHPEAPMLVMDVGHDRTDVVGVLGGRPIFVRTISHGGADVTAAIAATYRVDGARAEAFKLAQATLREPSGPPGSEPEAAANLRKVVQGAIGPLLRDLKQSVAALTAAAGVAPIAVAIAGGGARLDGLSEHIEAAVRLPVSPLDPPKLKHPIDAERFPLFAMALGLALRAGTKSPRIDLRRGRFAVKADAKAVRGRMVASMILFALVLLAWGFSAVSRYTVLQYEADRQRESLRSITKELLGEEIDDFARAAALAKGAGELQDPKPELDAFAVLDTLSKRIPSEIQHDIDELDVSLERAEIRGLVDTLADVDRVYESLSGEACFPVVNRGKTTRSSRDGRQKYQLDIELRCPAESEEGASAERGATSGEPARRSRTEDE